MEIASQYCPVCFRNFPTESKYWLKCPVDVVVKIVNQEWCNEDYKNLILNIIVQHENLCIKYKESEKENIGICVDCNIFFQKKEVCLENNTTCKKKRSCLMNCKHSMCVFVEYVLSGGTSVKPCDSFIFQATQSLLKNFPENPLLQIENGMLLSLMGSVNTYCLLTGATTCDLPEFVCVLKWIHCGASQMILDGDFAKKIRHFFRKNEGHDEWWKNNMISACRFCSGSPFTKKESLFVSMTPERIPYDLVIVSGKQSLQDLVLWILEEIEGIEKCKHCMDYVCSFCVRCCKYSIIQYEFKQDLSEKFASCIVGCKISGDSKNIEMMRYYSTKIIEFKKKKGDGSKRALQKRKFEKQRKFYCNEADY